MTLPTPHSLPPELESAFESILEGSAADRAERITALCRKHPSHADAIRAWAAGLDHTSAGAGPLPGLDDAMPRRIGRYKILGPLGEGGMGTVYAAEQTEPVERRVAIKVIKPGMDSKAVLGRFEAERQALALMNHPHIAKVLDAGTTERGQPFFVMELVRGTTLTQYCDQNKLPIPARLELFRQVCSGVQHAHHKGIVHRDLKPTNILVEMLDGRPAAKIIDFGLARALDHKLTEHTIYTEVGQIVGTPEYMSPEQAEMASADIDTRTDVYSLGVILYELLTGELPFSAAELRQAGFQEIRRKIREDLPPKPSTRVTTTGKRSDQRARQRDLATRALVNWLRGDLDWITMRALEKDRTRRYQTATELSADVERFLKGDAVTAGPPSAAYRIGKMVRRYRIQVGAAGAVLLAIVVALVVSWRMYGAAETARAAAETAREDASSQAQRAEQNLASYQRVSGVLAVEGLIHRARLSWPELPEAVPEMDAWLADAARLAPGRERVRADLPALRARAGRVEQRGKETVYEYADPEDQAADRQLSQLLLRFDELQGEQERVTARRKRAAVLRGESIDRYRAEWDAAILRVSRSERYSALTLTHQVGLVPLGPDPTTGLEEFAHVRSGPVPQREGGRLKAGDAGMAIILVLIPAGSFTMGDDDPGAPPNEKPVHRVTLAPYFIARHEVTQAQWMALSGGSNPASARRAAGEEDTLLHPIEAVSWNESVRVLRAHGLDLPTEAQWEHACRAGTTTAWWTGDDIESLRDAASLADKFSRSIIPGVDRDCLPWSDGRVIHHPADSMLANPFGLHHVIGNVAEWCLDAYGRYGAAEHLPGTGELSFRDEGVRVVRGGSWKHGPRVATSSRRLGMLAGAIYDNLGLRAARRIQP